MLKPAILYCEALTKKFDELRYSDKIVWYNGCIEDGRFYCYGLNDDGSSYGRFQYAILNNDEVVGYISYTIDYYSSCCYNFGLLSFEDKPNIAISSAILEVINKIIAQKIHRIEFRGISGNHACRFYDRLLDRFSTKDSNGSWQSRKLTCHDVFKDRYGEYHDSHIYEILRCD